MGQELIKRVTEGQIVYPVSNIRISINVALSKSFEQLAREIEIARSSNGYVVVHNSLPGKRVTIIDQEPG